VSFSPRSSCRRSGGCGEHRICARSSAIGLGAKMGNGLLACTLTWLVLEGEGAPEDMRLLAVAFLALVFGSVFLSLNACRRHRDHL